MGIINVMTLAAEAPNGLFEWLLTWLGSFISNFGWVVVLFTVILKLILLPLDIIQKKKAQKNNVKLKKLQPALEKIEKKYGRDRNLVMQKQQELYKKAGYNPMSGCLFMLIPLVVMIIAFTAFNSITAYKTEESYLYVKTAYQADYTQESGDTPYFAEFKAIFEENYALAKATDFTAETNDNIVNYDLYKANYQSMLGDGSEEAKANAQEQISVYYGKDAVALAAFERKDDGFLWIHNLWQPDTSARVAMSAEQYNKQMAQRKRAQVDVTEYNTVMAGVLNADIGYTIFGNKTGWNGLFLLPILSFLIGYGAQKVLRFTQPQVGNEEQTAGMMKTMLFILPITSAVFATIYSAAFALYLVVNSLLTTIISLIFMLVTKQMEKNQEATEVEKKYDSSRTRIE